MDKERLKYLCSGVYVSCIFCNIQYEYVAEYCRKLCKNENVSVLLFFMFLNNEVMQLLRDSRAVNISY